MFKITPLKWFFILSILAVLLAFGLPPDPKDVASLHTDPTSFRIALALLLVPYIAIWYTGFYAYAKIKEYAEPLKNTKDGKAFWKITIAMGVLAFSLVVPTLIALVLNYMAMQDRSLENATDIIIRYLTLYPGGIAMLLLYNGARELLGTAKNRRDNLDLRWYAPGFLLLAVVFSQLVIENHFTSDPYHLPLLVLMVTIIVPYLYAWMLGLLCVRDLNMYANTVKGKVYRGAIKRFASGVMVTVAASIAIQFVNVTIADRLKGSLGAVVVADYCLLAIVATGLVLIALGTKQLKRIEEV